MLFSGFKGYNRYSIVDYVRYEIYINIISFWFFFMREFLVFESIMTTKYPKTDREREKFGELRNEKMIAK